MERCAKIFAITSGKGGVGKTQVCANLAVTLAERGKNVFIVDADHGLANINIVLGIPSQYSSSMLSSEETYLELYQNSNPLPFILKSSLDVDLLSANSGLSANSQNFPHPNQQQIVNMINNLRMHYDVVLIDTAAGIEDNVKNYIAAADNTIVIINSEPTSLTDSFGLIRRMQNVSSSFEVIINRVPSADAATKIYKRFAGAVKKYIGSNLSALGYIKDDSLVSAALLSQRVLVKYSPNCMASSCINQISDKIMKQINDTDRNLINKKNTNSKQSDLKTETNISNAAIPSLNELTKKSEPKAVFDNWVNQIGQLINSEYLTRIERDRRVKQFMIHLELICDQDIEFLSALEALVVNLNIDEQSNTSKNKYSKAHLRRFNISSNSILS